MNCPNCNNEIPFGQTACPYCGTNVAQPMYNQQPMGGQPMYNQQPMGQPMDMGAPMGQPAYNAAPVYSAPAKKSPAGLIVGIVVAAIVLLGLLGVVIGFLVGGSEAKKAKNRAGRYDVVSYNLNGTEYDSASLNSYFDLEKDDSCTWYVETSGQGQTFTGKVTWDGDDMKVKFEGDALVYSGKYNASKNQITIEFSSGLSYTFEK